jgi:YVTN family beta-propeller protein
MKRSLFCTALFSLGIRALFGSPAIDNAAISVIDTASQTVVATISTGGSPWGVAMMPGGTKAYLTQRQE